MTTQQTKRYLAITIVLQIFLPITAMAQGYERRIHPGHDCRASIPAYGERLDPNGYRANGLKNPKSTSETLYCRMVRDWGENIYWAAAFIQSSSASCFIYGIDYTTDGYSSGEYTYYNLSGKNQYDDGIYRYYKNTEIDVTWMVSTLVCILPGGSIITAYDYKVPEY